MQSGLKKVLVGILMSRLQENLWYPPVLRAFVVTMLSALFLTVSLALWMPVYLNNKQNNQDVSLLEDEIRALQSNISLAKSLQRNRRAVTEVTDKLNQKISQAILIESLNKTVSNSGVLLSDQSFRETTTINGVEVYKQSLVINGSYGKIRHFLAQSDTMPVLNIINKITLNKEIHGVLAAQIDLDTYSVKVK